MPTLYCIGRNYAAHAREMGAPAVPAEEPIVFLKPEAAVVAVGGTIRLPPGAGEIHHETELVLRVGEGAKVEAIAIGLDLTDRSRQAKAQADGLPWARAKGFRGSAPIGPFVPVTAAPALDALTFSLRRNGTLQQSGETRCMLHSVSRLLPYLDEAFGLRPGDLIFTGTPQGVGPIAAGDVLELDLEGVPAASSRWTVI